MKVPSPASTTIEKMLDSLPEEIQDLVVEHLREYIQDLQDELQWDISFKRTSNKLIEVAQQAKKEIAQGKAKPLDTKRL